MDKNSTKSGQETDKTEAPRGLTYKYLEGASRPFQVRWYEGKLRPSAAFATEKERSEFADGWVKQRALLGKIAPIVVTKDVARWKLFNELTNNADPVEVAQFWLANKSKPIGGTITVADAARKFFEIRKAIRLNANGESHVVLHVGRFAAAFGSKQMGEVTADEVRAWMADLRNPDSGAPAEGWTKRHHLKNVKVFFSTARVEGWIATDQIKVISLPKIKEEDVTVLSVADAIRLFKANRDALCVGKLALEAFAGLRFSSAARLHGAEIHRKEKGIEMPGSKHKSGRRQYVDGYPENLWKWVKHAPQACWDIDERMYLKLKSEAFERAEVTNPGNVLRHSFCSYHVAVHKDAARTAVLLTHSNPKMLYQHYKGKATEADGKKYFSITP
jgi:integrase